MNADAFRHFFNYHFSENRKLWETCLQSLTPEEFTAPVAYSVGSIRNHIVHLISVDDTWFSGLRGEEIPEPLNPVHFHDRETIRTRWDEVEQGMRDYLNVLEDHTLLEQPLGGEDEDLYVWQVLLHVVNHGTDHRAQLLRLLYDSGVRTESQDYIFYVYDQL